MRVSLLTTLSLVVAAAVTTRGSAQAISAAAPSVAAPATDAQPVFASSTLAPDTGSRGPAAGRAVGPTLENSRLGLSAQPALASALTDPVAMQRRRSRDPGATLMIIGALGMIAGLLAHNGALITGGAVIGLLGVVFYLM